VIAYRMPGLCYQSHKLLLSLCGLTDHEESSARLMLLQDLENAGRVSRMGPVIKRESCYRVLCRDMGNSSHSFLQYSGKQSFHHSDVINA
jgi:hypothetical protein